ncbi:hypothetical protein MYAM1_001084 [Malassezia yamatoensis]|uniref:FIST domain-containing protein n=1 Tax=Malassezia yamatoensis TaxID=253288 RepID=A0AAJ5YRD4_9BASI|nr:hypothetical protein MYAM1_001084 [Malassezia yamatoensis]
MSYAAPESAHIMTILSTNAESLLPVLSKKLESWSDDKPKVLFFALSKSLPRSVMTQAIGSLNRTPYSSRVGFLSSALPASLIRPANGESKSSDLHSISVAAFPADHAIPFRSSIPGTARIAVGRWTSQKQAWMRGTEARSDRLDHTSDWRSLWGKENVDLQIPQDLLEVNQNDVQAIFFATDSSPQGMLEGLDAHYSHAKILGTTAALTPFETGREHTLFCDTETDKGKVYEDGAVGIALCDPSSSQTSLERIFEQLEPIGPRLELTGARGNVISSLDDHNAAQQFLRVIMKQSLASEKTKTMEASQVRDLSSVVDKEDEFYVSVSQSKSSAPFLLAKIASGHPMRGTLSLETDTELGKRTGSHQDSGRRYVQFYRPAPTQPLSLQGQRNQARFVFLTYPGDSKQQVSPDPAAEWAVDHTDGATELPNVFLAGSEQGWFARNSTTMPTCACNVPYARASLCDTG